jgi:hypothetical protein
MMKTDAIVLFEDGSWRYLREARLLFAGEIGYGDHCDPVAVIEAEHVVELSDAGRRDLVNGDL